MSSIDEMQISGVRSFHPSQESYIKFESPITIIAGQNGAGKTTIIECLRFMATGAYPPNAQGGMFLTDPKLIGRSEVKGKVMLNFRNHMGEQRGVTRMLQSTLKPRGQITFKTLDSILTKNNESISSRCTDTDKEMFRELGVSKYVLSSVIFCHQEESNWPLAECKELKTRFDNIFEITRFTKALENMKKLRSEYQEQIKVIENDLKHLTEKKQNVEDFKHELSSHEKTVSVKETEFLELEAFIEQREEDRGRNKEMLMRAQERDIQHKTKVTSRKHAQQNISSFEGKFLLIDPSGDVDMLKRQKEEHADRMSTEQRCQKSRERELKGVERERDEGEASLKELQQRLDKLDENRKSVEYHKRLLRELMDELSSIMTSTSSPLLSSPGALTRDTLSRGRSQLQLFESDLKSLTSEQEEEEGNILSWKEDLVRELAQQEQTCKIRGVEQSEAEQELLNIRKDGGFSKELEDLQDSIDIANEELISLKSSHDVIDLESNIKQLIQKKKDLEKRVPSLERENIEMEQEESTRKAVNSLKEDLESKNLSINKILSKINPDLESLFVWPPPLSELEAKLAKLKSDKEDEHKKVSSKLETLNKKLNDVRSSKNICEIQATQYQDNLNTFNSRKKELCGDQEYSQVIDDIKQEIQVEQDKMSIVSGSKQFYKECQSFVQQRNACPVCKRAFENLEILTQVLESLEKRIKHVGPSMMSQQQTQLSELGEKLENLQKLSGANDDMIKVEKSTIPGLQAEYDQLIIQEKELAQEINQLEKQAKSYQNVLDKISTLAWDVRVLNEKESERKVIESKISVESRKLKNPIASKSIEEIKQQLRKNQKEIKAFESKISEHQTSINNHKDEVRDKEQEINELTAAQLEQQKHKQNQANQLARKIELEQKLDNLNKGIKEVKLSLTPIKQRILKYENELKEKHAEYKQIVDIERSKIEQFKSLITKINEKQKEIDSASLDNSQTDYEDCVHEIEVAKSNINKLNTRLQELREIIANINNEIANSQNKNREYSDAIQLQGYQENLRVLNIEIAELASELNTNPIQKLQSSITQLESSLKQKRSKRDKLTGEIDQMKKQIAKVTRTLESDQYRDVMRVHDAKKYELKVVRLVVKDLEYSYHKLDRCMMQFHKSKIEQINAILQELWQSIYKGPDIDYIQIVADDESTASPSGRGSYNYRVVMMKGDIEMGMRGRCSTGQKVLACILIRLALAETFCSKCGIIALDEPTTNLDRRNMVSLADSLIELLDSKAKSNFQMILITHDQKFVEAFKHSEFVEHYWKLTKSDNFSKIQKLAFSDNY
ncbi:DNA repair protein RAD50 [Oopsacas minuta]|uniref:DNA repair protein RAD50 n=1 Tax=Oopsacas minuta TaxID=111878 RepID=A0AAV7JRU9_9METZ|nr:DNA repair protein RAD50 [Oopsacas minuta]